MGAVARQSSQTTDIAADILEAASGVIAAHGVRSLTAERLAAAAGCSRMTLHRRGVTPAAVLEALRAQALISYQVALMSALAHDGTARERLRLAIDATLAVADGHLALLAGMFTDDDAVFHDGAGDEGPLPTADEFVAPFRRLLLDGAADGTLRPVDDATETATVLFNALGWTYVQLRWTQRWPSSRARAGVVDLLIEGLLPR